MKNLQGKGLRSLGRIELEGEALVSATPITLLGFIDAASGEVTDPESPLCGTSITGKVFVFPRGIGSTVGPYVLVNLARNGMAPMAMINRESDQGTVAGASVARIPLAYAFDHDPLEAIKQGDRVRLRIEDGRAQLEVL